MSWSSLHDGQFNFDSYMWLPEFGKRRKSIIKIEGITVNMPLIMEVIDLRSKITSLSFVVKRMVGDSGLVTVQEIGFFNYEILRQGRLILVCLKSFYIYRQYQ